MQLKKQTVPEIGQVKRTLRAMGTTVTIAIYAEEFALAREAISRAFKAIVEIEKEMNYRRPEGELFRLNEKANLKEVAVSPALFGVLRRSVQLSRLTKGAFDVTMLPLTRLWSEHFREGTIPSMKDIERRLSRVGWESLVLDEGRLTVRFEKSGMAIDLGGIAKGYAVDRAIAVIKSVGVTNAIVEAGGDLYAIGNPSKTKGGWPIGVKHPRNPDELIFVVESSDEGMATSGNYHHSAIIEGRRYHHILDPRTGLEAMGMMSVTVTAADTMTADVLATAGFVLGREKGPGLMTSLEAVDWLMVTEAGNVIVSKRLMMRAAPVLRRVVPFVEGKGRERDVDQGHG